MGGRIAVYYLPAGQQRQNVPILTHGQAYISQVWQSYNNGLYTERSQTGKQTPAGPGLKGWMTYSCLCTSTPDDEGKLLVQQPFNIDAALREQEEYDVWVRKMGGRFISVDALRNDLVSFMNLVKGMVKPKIL